MSDVPEPPERLPWLDAAKGACILLVVLHHVVTKQLAFALPPELAWVEHGWAQVTLALKPVRMPVFFAISGFFAAGAIHRPWRSVLRRATTPYYLYLVWLVVYAVLYRFETVVEANRTNDLRDLAGEVLLAETSMWFLYALAVYFVLAKVLRRLPPSVVVAAAGVLALATGWSGIEEYNTVSVLAHFGFFAVGAYFPAAVRRAGALGGRTLLNLLAVYVAAVVAVPATGLPWSVTLVTAGIAGVPLGLGAAPRIARVPWVGPALGWIGRRTLRVYVLHFAAVAAVVHLPLALSGTGFDGAVLALLLPLAVSAGVVAACLVGHEVLVASGGRALFRMPRRLEAAHATWAGRRPRAVNA